MTKQRKECVRLQSGRPRTCWAWATAVTLSIGTPQIHIEILCLTVQARSVHLKED